MELTIQSLRKSSDHEHLVRCLEFLQYHGSDAVRHSGRTLLQHLYGTYELLKDHDEPEAVCRAGLFHSVYGTESFQHTVLDVCSGARERVKDLIGTEAERLAYLFCTLPRPRCLFDGSFRGHEREKLLTIECANLLEQGGFVAIAHQIMRTAA